MDTSYLTQQVGTIISQLHGLFDDIGVPHNERDARESEVWNYQRTTKLCTDALLAVLSPV